MSTKFKVNRDFRGELILPTLENKMLTSGSVVSLNDEQMKNPHIRMAVRSGTLVEDDPVEEIVIETKEEVVVEVEEPVVVKKKRGRKKKVVSEADDVVEKKTTKVKKATKDKPKKVESEAIEEVKMTIDLNDKRPEEPKTNMSSWNPEDGEMIDKTKSMKKVMSDLNGVEMDVQQSSKKETVDFEDELNKITETLKDGVKKKIPTLNKKAKKKAGRKSKKLQPVGKKRELSDMLDESLSNEGSLVEAEDIIFVDAEQDKARLSQRPALKEKDK